jgi:integrase
VTSGDDAVSDFERRHLQAMCDKWYAEGGPAAGNNLRRMLKLLFKLALRRNVRADDPTIGIEKYKAAKPAGKEAGFRTWSEDDIDAFIAKYPLGTREYLALSLLLYTGQRRGDVVKLGPKNIKGKYDPKNFTGRKLSFVQEKTGTSLTIPIHAKLAEALAQANIPADAPAFLLTHRCKPFTPEGFGNYFSECADLAGIKEQASAHGLRKAAATRLADAGCSPHEVMAITGHVSLSEVQRYTKAAQQERLAEQAMSKML